MYLSAYDFDGDPVGLHNAYDRLVVDNSSDQFVANLCVDRPGGITVYDSCPTRDDFETSSTSDELRSALRAAGLPSPRVEAPGGVYRTIGFLLGTAP